jgi:D-arabinose 1-dehydrogenase-like Zn-dependent alcohol dehydrogenase
MRAAVLPRFGADLKVVDVPEPRPISGEVLIEVIACGAGLTLEHVRNGVLGGTPPFTMGHEFAGRIIELGPNVTGWSVGDAVTATFYLTCGDCDMCTSAHDTLCRNFAGWIGAARDGAFAERVAVPTRNLVKVPDGVGLDIAGVVADAVATPYHVAKDRLQIGPGDKVAVLGAGGGLGVHMLAVIRAFGGKAIGIERDRAKLETLRAGRLADLLVDASAPDWEAVLGSAAAGQLTGFVDTVGSTETLAAGARAVGPRGAVVILGVTVGAEVRVDAQRMLLGETAVMGTRYCNRAEIAASLALVAAGRIIPVIGRRFRLDEINDAFAAIRSNDVFGRVVIDVVG